MWVKETEDQCETELVFRAKRCEAHVQPAPGEEDSFGTEKLELSKNVCRSLFQNKWQIRRAHSEGGSHGSMAPLLLGSIVEAQPHQFELQDQGIPPPGSWVSALLGAQQTSFCGFLQCSRSELIKEVRGYDSWPKTSLTTHNSTIKRPFLFLPSDCLWMCQYP